jgi:inositol hexakisphosphate/diphosphoinositol-pentakisphosphate kinase
MDKLKERKMPELDYASHITFELYERNYSDPSRAKEFSIGISISEVNA